MQALATDAVLDWLLAGDVSIQYQVHRDLLDERRPDLQALIETEGWGARLLGMRQAHGHWGRGYYQPKWTSSHYTLLLLRELELPANAPAAREVVDRVLDEEIGQDGGIAPGRTIIESDVCVTGMMLHIAAWFGASPERLHSLVDFVLTEHMPDGGFNCRSNRGGARHSSMHSTLSVLEGIGTYRELGNDHQLDALLQAAAAAREFLLRHRLYRSDRTGEIIQPAFLRMPYPARWKYDILRALDYFRSVDHADPRLGDAIDVLRTKRRADGRWRLNARHPGAVHFEMERAGQPSRWNTLRALRILRWHGMAGG